MLAILVLIMFLLLWCFWGWHFSMTRKGIFFKLVGGLVLGLGLVLYIRGLTAEEYWVFEEYAGIALLCLLAFAGFSIITAFSVGELAFQFMEGRGDSLFEKGKKSQARKWYTRCLILDDRLLNNTVRRVVVMGKLSRAYEDLGKNNLARHMDSLAEKVKAGEPEPISILHRDNGNHKPLSASVHNSWIYKYAFSIIFGSLGLTYGILGYFQTGWILLLVGAALNVYWLHADSQDA